MNHLMPSRGGQRLLRPLMLSSIISAFKMPFAVPRQTTETESLQVIAARDIMAIRKRTPAAVMLLLQETPSAEQRDLQLILTRRPQSLAVHPGEVCFPGGKRDETDASLYATAVRETHEEIGIPASVINYIGSLPTFTSLSGFTIKPFVASIPADFTPVPNVQEVASILYLSAAEMINGSRFTYQVTLHKRPITLYFFDHPRFPFWGATAAIASQLVEFLSVACTASDD